MQTQRTERDDLEWKRNAITLAGLLQDQALILEHEGKTAEANTYWYGADELLDAVDAERK